MTAVKTLITAPTPNDEHIPCRYLQLPTIFTAIFRDYFSPLNTVRWLPAVSHLKHYDTLDPLTAAQLEDAIEIDRFEKYSGIAINQSLPKILVKRSTVAKTNVGIGDATRGGMNGLGGNSGIKPSQYSGTVVCFCLSKTFGQADFIAGEVEQFLTHFSGVIACQLKLNALNSSQVSDVVELVEFPGFFAVPVVTDYNYEDNIEVTKTRPNIRSIQIVLS